MRPKKVPIERREILRIHVGMVRRCWMVGRVYLRPSVLNTPLLLNDGRVYCSLAFTTAAHVAYKQLSTSLCVF